MSVTEVQQAANVKSGLPEGAPPRKIRRFWSFFISIACLGGAAIGIRMLQIDGWLRAVEVVGPSMAPTLWGPSISLTCNQCGITLRSVAPSHEAAFSWTCSNCGQSQTADDLHRIIGDHVWIDRGAYWFRAPRREELVAVCTADGSLRVKRVVGLPGETIRIEAGDLFIAGKRWQKSWADSLSRLTLVYDDRFRNPNGPARWEPTAGSQIESKELTYLFSPAEHFQFLRYHHFSPYVEQEPWHPAAIVNDSPINPQLSQILRPTSDHILFGMVSCTADCQIFVAHWSPSGVRVRQFSLGNDTQVAWQFGMLDSREVLVLDGLLQGTPSALETPAEFPSNLLDAQHPFLLGCRGNGSCRIENLRIMQDIYLLGPPASEKSWQSHELQADHYLLLGDNVALSADDRQRPSGTPRKQIIGQVLPRP